jgi:DNA-binding transcriptional regulator YiaG
VDLATVLDWEKDRTTPGARRMAAVCRFLGCLPGGVGEGLPGRLRAARQVLGLTQDDHARQLGVDPETLRRWEHGRRRPPTRLAAIVASTMDAILASVVATDRVCGV